MKYFVFLLFVFSSLVAKEDIQVENPKIHLVPAQSKNSAMFCKILNNSSKDIALIKAESSISKTVELHGMVMEGQEMKMRPVEKFLIKAKTSLELKPGSFHMMFIDLKQALKLGEKHKVTFSFDNGQKIQLDVPVEKIEMQSHMNMEHKHK
jgi:hypothetical protein